MTMTLPSNRLRRRLSALSVGLLLAASALAAVACSGTNATPGGGGDPNGTGESKESHGSEQANGACRQELQTLKGNLGSGESCQTYLDCAPTCCACVVQGPADGYNAAACVEGKCANAATACALAKSADYCPADPITEGDGGTKGDAKGDAAPITSTDAICVPFTGSHASDRAAERLAATDLFIKQVTTQPSNGTLNISRNTQQQPTYISFSASGGSGQSYNVSISYNSGGKITYMKRSWSGSTASDTYNFSYNSADKLTYFKLTWSDSTASETENFSYNSANKLTYFKRSWSDSTASETLNYSYNSSDLLTYFKSSWSDSTPSVTESFSYDSSSRLTHWSRSWSDSTPSESASLSYSGTSRAPSSTQTSGPVPPGSQVVDCGN